MTWRTFLGACVAGLIIWAAIAATALHASETEPCGGGTNGQPDPCKAAQYTIQHIFTLNMSNAQTFKNWRRDNPGEVNRLEQFMLTPTCPTPANPMQPVMKTRLGWALINVFQAYACALGEGPLSFPAPLPAPAGADKTPPTIPVIRP